MKKTQLFFDMDEVIVGLSKYIVEDCYNDDYNDNMKWTDNHKYWWSDCKLANKSYFQQLLLKEGTFLHPKPIEGAIEILNKLHKEGYDIHIITSPQWESRYCIREKVQWIEKYLPFININSNFHCTDNKGLLAKENHILIDDNPKHLNNWKNNDGNSICFNYENVYRWSRDWNGIVCYNWSGIYIEINELKINGNLETKETEKATYETYELYKMAKEFNYDIPLEERPYFTPEIPSDDIKLTFMKFPCIVNDGVTIFTTLGKINNGLLDVWRHALPNIRWYKHKNEKSVPFIEAIQSNKPIKINHTLIKECATTRNCNDKFMSISKIISMLGDCFNSEQINTIITEGKWYIKNTEEGC